MYIPIRSLSAITRRSVEVMSVAMKSYFDGSGKYRDPNSKMLTLAGWGSQSWGNFEGAWSEMLKAHDAPYLHMKEMMSYCGRIGSPFGSWDQDRVDRFVDAAISTAINHQFDGLKAFSCTVSITEHKAVSARRKVLDAQNYCSMACLADVLNYEEKTSQHQDRMELYFDKEDDFFYFWVEQWGREDRQIRELDLIDQLSGLRSTKEVFPMQLADLLAWLQNRRYTVGDREGWLDRLLTLPHSCREWVENKETPIPRPCWTGEGLPHA